MTSASTSKGRAVAGFGPALGVFLALLAVLAQVLVPGAHALTCAEQPAVVAAACCEPGDAPVGASVEAGDSDLHDAPCAVCASVAQLHAAPDLRRSIVVAVLDDPRPVSSAIVAGLLGRRSLVHGARAPPVL